MCVIMVTIVFKYFKPLFFCSHVIRLLLSSLHYKNDIGAFVLPNILSLHLITRTFEDSPPPPHTENCKHSLQVKIIN